MPSKRQDRRENWIAALLITIVAGVSYLLLARRFGFYGDDWYLVYAGQTEGPNKFIEIFAIDRPFRAYFVGLVYSLFGLHAPLYSYFSYALRVVEALGMVWLVRLVWPRQKRLAVLLGVLFVVYPGWMDQPAAFDYQSHLLAFALELLSLGLTIQALRTQHPSRRAGLIALAAALEAVTLLLMEYYIGLEGLRFALILYACGAPDLRRLFTPWRDFWARLRRALLHELPYLFTAVGFLFWRAALFDGARAATDLSEIASSLAGSPLMRGLWSLVLLVQDFFNVTLMAWFVPVYQMASNLRLRDALVAIGLGLAMAALTAAAWAWLKRGAAPAEADCASDGLDMLILGSLGVIFALIPILLGDRHVVFPTFARFTLTGSAGAVIALGGLLALLERDRLRLALSVTLIGLAVMGHYGNSVAYAKAWSGMRDFWWQVSWRAPQIAPQTVLAADYSAAAIPEDYLVWGPANLIYYPEKNRPQNQTTTPLGAVVLNGETVQGIQMGRELAERERRSIISSQDLSQALVISMPFDGACAHVIDGKQPELSDQEDDRIYRVAGGSQIERILVDAAPHTPPPALFGSEPAHRWCYAYQKAGLARQRGDWGEVARLGDEVAAQGLHPVDWVEWMPFVQAYAYLGREADADRLAPILKDKPYLKFQACRLFTQDARGDGKSYPEGQRYLQEQFCR